MTGPHASALLRRLSRTAVRRTLARRIVIWAVSALFLTSLASAAGIFGLLLEPAFNAVLILILSTFPCVLYFPPDGKAAIRALRSIDKRATLESALAAPLESAAEPLLRVRGEKMAMELGGIELPHARFSRSARILFAAAAAGVTLTQFLGIWIVGSPILGYVAPASRAGLAEEGRASFARTGEIDELELESLLVDRGENTDSDSSVHKSVADLDSKVDFANLDGLLRSEQAEGALGRGGEAPNAGERAPEDGLNTIRSLPENAAGDRFDRSSDLDSGSQEPSPMGSGPGEKGSGQAPRDPRRGPGSGWSESAGPSARNAMKDYRADFERVYSERTTKAITMGSDLSLTELETAISRYFDSFLLRIGVEPEEDPFAAGLRAAWRRILGGLK